EFVALPNVIESGPQILKTACTVAFAEPLPGEVLRQTGKARDVPKPANRVARRLELEEEGRARRTVKRIVVRRAPKIYLLAPLLLRKEVKPVIVRNSYPTFHRLVPARLWRTKSELQVNFLEGKHYPNSPAITRTLEIKRGRRRSVGPRADQGVLLALQHGAAPSF